MATSEDINLAIDTLRASNGLSFGAICAIDTQPRLFEPAAVRELEALGQLITDSLQLRVYEGS
jgi:hypothetical protein